MRFVVCFLAAASVAVVSCSRGGDFREISLAELEDRIEGGWAGQMIGVSFGEPTEFRYLERIIPQEDLAEWSPDRVAAALEQDDLYVEMTFSEVLDEKGLDATTEDFAAMFRDAGYRLWHANLAARRALKRGVPAGESGSPRHNVHANDIDFQIESDFIGLMSPGLPAASNDLCWRVGRVMNSGDGIYGGMFVSAMYAAAFFERDPRAVVEIGLGALPPESPYARVVRDVLTWSEEHPDDWQVTWQLIEDEWNHREPCPQGALNPFNIDAKLNGAYIALGLLYGDGDFERTLEISTRAGQDSDCNPSSALGILGVMLGYDGIPDRWTSGIPDIADERFSFTDHSFRSIVESTKNRAVVWAERHGGRLEGDALLVPVQEPVPARLDIWDDYGSPVERITTDDSRWSFHGPWEKEEMFSFGAKTPDPDPLERRSRRHGHRDVRGHGSDPRRHLSTRRRARVRDARRRAPGADRRVFRRGRVQRERVAVARLRAREWPSRARALGPRGALPGLGREQGADRGPRRLPGMTRVFAPCPWVE